MQHPRDPQDHPGRPRQGREEARHGRAAARHGRRRRTGRGAAVAAPRRHAKQRWTYQGVGTVVAGAVAVAAVAIGTVVLGGTGGEGGSLATRTAAPAPSLGDRPASTSGTTPPTSPAIPAPRPSRSAPPSPHATPAASIPAPARTTPAPPGRHTTAGTGKRPSTTPASPTARVGDADPYAARPARPGGTVADHVRRVVALANAERAKAGCPALRTDSRLQEAAQGHADDMAARDYYAHDTPEGQDAGDRIGAAGYRWSTWAENIHRGPGNPATAVRDWMKSPSHRANILNCAFRDIGVGVNLRPNGPWWVQNFGATG
ncbi:CAP domain-containing protein [Streptomyces sp. TRM76323]|uniref:CAP domain-containing protein n=1 Tax=Streptomyces tamarix TaxID=3078565 RepID=A0ABU3QPG3_9ACTN|nr:CAP domain-containing protein [Streptomyces tamarix]MDT9684650.1 CAP domain-containing protein [Streptomyces tamarix]